MVSDDREHKPATVFIVDDHPAVLEALALLMESVGLSVKTFSSPRDFLNYPKCDGPCCLVSDIRMPEMSGLELQEEMLEKGNHTPIIFITAHGDIPMSVEAMKRGAADFLEKPFKFFMNKKTTPSDAALNILPDHAGSGSHIFRFRRRRNFPQGCCQFHIILGLSSQIA